MGAIGTGAKFLARLAGSGLDSKAATALGVGLPIGQAVGEGVVEPLGRGLYEGVTGRGERAALELFSREQLERRATETRISRLRARLERTKEQLERLDPQLYNEVKAGRKLPPGSVWVGRARTDLLDELASRVVMGDI